ncbi:hypothetical protein AMTR_s00027p00247590 [Amborella trichopoda]|uniref:Uncharacterized protein n=1 Tax=Amborella trichopoda TaxID=13333 RepID=W1PSM6_AMBTC|nr:hypothetical protein AMTR_s00027p00247590 [Amborella trichopoda]
MVLLIRILCWLVSNTIDPLRVIPHLEASPLRLLGGPSIIDDSVSKVDVVESDSVDVVIEEPKVAAIVSDMGMDFNIPIKVFFDEVKQIKKARRSVDSGADITQSFMGRFEKTSIVNKASKHKKFSSLGSRVFSSAGGPRHHQEHCEVESVFG